jgi:small subunit ribosomal protein S3
MGQKINPIGMRVGINRTWDSRWYAGRDYAEKLIVDLKLREYVQERLKAAGISKVIIERAAKNTKVNVHTARPGVIIGKKGADIEKLRRELSERAGGEVSLNIIEVRKPEADAQLVRPFGRSRYCPYGMVSRRSRAVAHIPR